ncbi:MAG: O-antigen ligase family protein, partial [Endomicrobium sp.]|nr:O-antigen ligase family protein [Endomicrobium sp.]
MSLYIRISLICSIFFAVFSFAAVEPWSALVLQTAVFFLFAVYLLGNETFEISGLNKGLLLFFAITITLGLIQCMSERTVLDGAVKYPFTFSALYTASELIYCLFLLTAALLSSFVFNGYKKIKNLLLAFAVCGVVVVIAANVFPDGEYIAVFRHLKSSDGSFGPFVNRNNAGVFLGFCFFCALAYFFARHFEYAAAERKNFLYEQISAAAICFLLFYGVISTRSRGAMLFLALSLVFVAAIFIILFVKNKNKKIISFIVLFLVSASVFAAVFLNLGAINKFAGRANGASDKARMEIYSSALEM